jgi:hypothetical protein
MWGSIQARGGQTRTEGGGQLKRSARSSHGPLFAPITRVFHGALEINITEQSVRQSAPPPSWTTLLALGNFWA